jgi:hypothetical protein
MSQQSAKTEDVIIVVSRYLTFLIETFIIVGGMRRGFEVFVCRCVKRRSGFVRLAANKVIHGDDNRDVNLNNLLADKCAGISRRVSL